MKNLYYCHFLQINLYVIIYFIMNKLNFKYYIINFFYMKKQ